MLDAVAKLVSTECREWIGSPSELAEALQTGMASNALTKHLNVKAGRLLEEYHVGYENKAKHSGRQVKLTYMLVESTAWIGSPSELAEALQTGMASNALTKHLNVKAGRLLEEYHVGYENKAKHSGRQVKLTYMLVESTACEVTEEYGARR